MPPVKVDPDKVRLFEDAESFYAWLGKHHDIEDELWIRIFKIKSGVKSITSKEAIDAVLCWGWIDGICKGLDDKSFLQRYTRRRKGSVWSQVNRDNVERLVAAGLMQPQGQAEVDLARADGRIGDSRRDRNSGTDRCSGRDGGGSRCAALPALRCAQA